MAPGAAVAPEPPMTTVVVYPNRETCVRGSGLLLSHRGEEEKPTSGLDCRLKNPYRFWEQLDHSLPAEAHRSPHVFPVLVVCFRHVKGPSHFGGVLVLCLSCPERVRMSPHKAVDEERHIQIRGCCVETAIGHSRVFISHPMPNTFTAGLLSYFTEIEPRLLGIPGPAIRGRE